jgi:hypothetical protein
MKIDILSFSTYKLISESNQIEQLIGTQCIYPLNLQTSILKTFITAEPKPLKINLNSKRNFDTDSDTNSDTNTNSYLDSDSNDDNFNNLAYCFEINKICFYPKYTYSDPNITIPIIIISDYFYNKYFLDNCNAHNLNIIYNIPSVKMIRLKRIKGDFPSDDSIEYLLTDYFESCSIVNIDQEFEIELYDDSSIKFCVDEISYKNNFSKNINQRITEMNYMIKFNTIIVDEYPTLKVPSGISECESIITDYEWHYHTLGKKKSSLGYLVNNNVEIDFVVSEIPSNPSNTTNLNFLTSPTSVTSNLTTTANSTTTTESNQIRKILEETNYIREVLTADEIRKKRLEFFQKQTK